MKQNKKKLRTSRAGVLYV